ncbi:hypothetical protein DFH01_02590 [Falsiroseomonas bella]|uniref:RapA2 cadherin-like domain-containing protein n=1 Tax=Falsiroseomonas bella TaxID=2184016 RepID=A0A317FHD3_9PROT|nr:VCBS domain-containing protein [Falsiroseomonas bella]PWS38205.1 hypothetical protein DFH01_02590 [Falsiroseomonas bella]
MARQTIWFGTRAVDFLDPVTGEQIGVLDEASDFFTRRLASGEFDTDQVTAQQLLAFIGTTEQIATLGIDLSDGVVDAPNAPRPDVTLVGDLQVGEGVVAHNIADVTGGTRVTDLTGALGEEDPVRISGHGRANGAVLAAAITEGGGTGNYVTFSNGLGFGLIGGSGWDPGGNATRLNDGESITFTLAGGRMLAEASFTVRVLNAGATTIALDSDGRTIRDTNDAAQGGFVQDGSAGEVLIRDVADGTRVRILFDAGQVLVGDAAIEAAAFLAAFAEAGGAALTLGSVVGNAIGWSADDLILETRDAEETIVNRAPDARDDAFGATPGGADVTAALLSNDVDPEGLPLQVVAVGPASSGFVSLVDGVVAYTADAAAYRALGEGQTLDVTFTYTVRDAGGLEDTATATLTLTGVNDAPVAADLIVMAPGGSASSWAFPAYDAEPGALDFEMTSGPAKGRVTLFPGGTFTFDPGEDFAALPAGGSEVVSFSYVAMDEDAALSAERTVTLVVLGGALAPGSDADDTVAPSAAAQLIDPGLGNDSVDAGGGDDAILHRAGEGQDSVDGGDGRDTLVVVANAVTITAAGGRLVVQTGPGSGVTATSIEEIVLRGTDGSDNVVISGDLASVGVSPNTVRVDGGDGDDVINGALLAGTPPVRLVADGGAGNDQITGGDADDILSGGDGDDRLGGGAGLNVLYGGAGADTFEGGQSNQQEVFVLVAGEANGDVLRNVDGFGYSDIFVTLPRDNVFLVGYGGAPAIDLGGGTWQIGGDVIRFESDFGPWLPTADVFIFVHEMPTDFFTPIAAPDGLVFGSPDPNQGFAPVEVSGTLLANDRDPDGSPLRIKWVTDVVLLGVTSPLGGWDARFDVFGSEPAVFLQGDDGSQTLTLDSAFFGAMALGQTAEFTFAYTIFDQAGFESRATGWLSIAGTADDATIGGDLAAAASLAGPQVGGRATIADPDIGEAVFTLPSGLSGSYGQFTFDVATGEWTYLLDGENADVLALAPDETLQDRLRITSLDGSAEAEIVVELRGNAPPVAEADFLFYRATEPGEVLGVIDITDALLANDSDPEAQPLEIVGVGEVTFAWDPTPPDSIMPEVTLQNGRVLLETDDFYRTLWEREGATFDIAYTIRDAGGLEATVTAGITLVGVNDPGTITGSLTARIDASNPWAFAQGELLIEDADFGMWFADADPADVSGPYGSFGFDPYSGAWSFTYDPTTQASQALLPGDLVTETLTVTLLDGGASRTIAVNIFVPSAGPPPVFLADIAAGMGGFRMLGDEDVTADGLGVALATVGDLNGDGRSDLIVGAPRNSAGGVEAGAAYVVFGKADGAAVPLENVAAGQGGFAIIGETGQDLAGTSVSAIGDMNGDGLPEMLISALSLDPTGTGRNGAAYVVWGQADSTAVNLDDVAAGTGGFKVIGSDGQLAGDVVRAVGDLNGDGLPDFAITSRGSNNGGESPGLVHVVWGKADGDPVALADVTAGTGGFVITGEDGGQRILQSLTSIADLNGDGLREILIGSEAWTQGDEALGRAYVVWGKADGGAVDLAAVATGNGGFAITLGGQGAWSASVYVSSLGDINGDGLEEILLGSPFADAHAEDVGGAFVVWGKADSAPVEIDLAGTAPFAGFRIQGEAAYDFAGFSVADAGDMNGDGRSDILIGSPYNDAGGDFAGAAYLVWGQDDLDTITLSGLAQNGHGVKFIGAAPGDGVGWAVGSAGDMNGDGRGEVLIGQISFTSPLPDPGSAYVVFAQSDWIVTP